MKLLRLLLKFCFLLKCFHKKPKRQKITCFGGFLLILVKCKLKIISNLIEFWLTTAKVRGSFFLFIKHLEEVPLMSRWNFVFGETGRVFQFVRHTDILYIIGPSTITLCNKKVLETPNLLLFIKHKWLYHSLRDLDPPPHPSRKEVQYKSWVHQSGHRFNSPSTCRF